MAKKQKVAEYIICGNPACGRKLLAESYAATIPAGVPSEKIHREYRPGQPLRTVMCTCGHYTKHVDRQSEGP